MGYAEAPRGGRAVFLQEALQGLTSGRFAEAERLAREVASDDPSDVEAALLVGLAVAAQGDAWRAAPVLQRVAAARPDFAHPCRDLAQICASAPDRTCMCAPARTFSRTVMPGKTRAVWKVRTRPSSAMR